MKQVIIVLGLFLSIQFLSAQDQKQRVAVFDPTSASASIDEGTKEAVREVISEVFVNTGKYSMVERAMLQSVMKEQSLSNTDAFDESKAAELGKMAGASKIVVSVITVVGGNSYGISIKIIDVITTTIEQQKMVRNIRSLNDLLDAAEASTAELLGVKINNTGSSGSSSGLFGKKTTETKSANPTSTSTPTSTPTPDSTPVPVNPPVVTPTVTPTVTQPQQASTGEDVSLYFAGFSSGKNPTAKIYVDGTFIGTGTLYQGFSVSFAGSHGGKHIVKIEWDSVISTKEYKINTSAKKQFVFEYVRGGFGYEFGLKK